MELVCITGIDGSGKTTLARNTVTTLRQQDQPAVYVYGRTCPAISRLLMTLGRSTLLRKNNQWHDYGAYTRNKKQAMRNPILAWLYTATIWLDYYVQIWLKLLPHILSQRIVVSDRYVYDTVISDLAVHLGYTCTQTERAIKRGLRALPTPTLTVLIDVPEEIAFSRKTDIPDIDYLRERRGRYLKLRARPEVEQIDGGNSPGALLQAVLLRIANSQRGDVSL
jgi:dTMP kinase